MAITKVFQNIAKFTGGIIIPTGAGSNKVAISNAEGKVEWGSVTLSKLAAAVQKQIPAEHGRSAEMVSGKITISAPAVTASGAIIISCEGTTMTVGAVVTERTAGTGFKVEAAATSTDRVNWAVWTE